MPDWDENEEMIVDGSSLSSTGRRKKKNPVKYKSPRKHRKGSRSGRKLKWVARPLVDAETAAAAANWPLKLQQQRAMRRLLWSVDREAAAASATETETKVTEEEQPKKRLSGGADVKIEPETFWQHLQQITVAAAAAAAKLGEEEPPEEENASGDESEWADGKECSPLGQEVTVPATPASVTAAAADKLEEEETPEEKNAIIEETERVEGKESPSLGQEVTVPATPVSVTTAAADTLEEEDPSEEKKTIGDESERAEDKKSPPLGQEDTVSQEVTVPTTSASVPIASALKLYEDEDVDEVCPPVVQEVTVPAFETVAAVAKTDSTDEEPQETRPNGVENVQLESGWKQNRRSSRNRAQRELMKAIRLDSKKRRAIDGDHARKSAKCDFCEGFVWEAELNRHKINAHGLGIPVEGTSTEENNEPLCVYPCDQCDCIFYTANGRRRHMFRSHENMPHKCLWCTSQFFLLPDLIRHYRTHKMPLFPNANLIM